MSKQVPVEHCSSDQPCNIPACQPSHVSSQDACMYACSPQTSDVNFMFLSALQSELCCLGKRQAQCKQARMSHLMTHRRENGREASTLTEED